MPTKRRATLGTVRATRNRWKAWYERNGQTHRPGRTFTTEEDAWAWLRAEQGLIDTDKWSPPAQRRVEAEIAEERNSTTVADYAGRWIDTRVTRKAKPLHPRTKSDYRRYLSGILAPVAERPIVHVTLTDLKRWHDANNVRPVLRHRSYSFIRSVFGTAVGEGLIAENPCQVENATRKPRPKVNPDKVVKSLTPAKIGELADLVQPRDRALILLQAYCCVRTGEACALRRPDLELGTGPDGLPFGWLTVERGISSYDGARHESGTKTDEQGERVVPIPPHIIADLLIHLDTYAEPGPDGLLFPSTNAAMDFRTTQQINGHAAVPRRDGKGGKAGYGWYHARVEAGVPTMHLQWLRHWGATLWDEAGTPEAIRRAILGHAQPGMTGHYTHPDTTKASPYALKVSQLAGWMAGSGGSTTPPAPSTSALASILSTMDTDSLANALAALDADQITEVVPLLPSDRMAAAVASLAGRRPKSRIQAG